jgi:sec-independent protein translocase protein TatC
MALDQLEGKKDANEMSFLEHLEQLRWHIIRALLAILVVAVVVFLAKDFVFTKIIFAPLQDDFVTYATLCGISDFLCFKPTPFEILTRDLGEQFLTHLKVSFWLGLICAFPIVFWEFWRFIKPGLYDKERKRTRGVVLICSVLFMLGVMFGYYIISPFAISFLSGYSVGVTNAPTLNSYVNYLTMITIPGGFVFELPVVVYFLAKIGIVGPDSMKQYRRHAVIAILLLASIITPPDLITQLLIAVPLYGLYEISIFIAKRMYKGVDDD